MKPEEAEINNKDTEDAQIVTGDVIGDTAYSERYVLKILLKFANLGTLKEEIVEKTFEEDLCTLWDMTAERDVVLFLQKHDVLNLFCFAMPVVESPRIIEIIVGIIANMCCQKEVVDALLKMDFLNLLLEYLKTDDSLILVQVLRLVSSGLFLAKDDDLSTWMDLFKAVTYSKTLYFILKNSTNKELLVTALENLNTVCSYCNVEKCRQDFFNHFITAEALESLSASFSEVVLNQSDNCEREELERIFVITLQILLTIIGFSTSPQMYKENNDEVIKIIHQVLNYYENKIVDQKDIDADLVDIIDSTNTILDTLKLSNCDPEMYFLPSFNMWKTVDMMNNSKETASECDDKNKEDLKEFSQKLKPALSLLLCSYMEKCTEDNLVRVLDEIETNYEDILSLVENENTKANVMKRTSNYRTRLKDNVDS